MEQSEEKKSTQFISQAFLEAKTYKEARVISKYDNKIRKWTYNTKEISLKESILVLKSNLDLKSIIKNILNHCKSNELEKLEPDKKVYFTKPISFSRKWFKNTYPTNKIVFDIKKADIIIIDSFKLKDFSPYHHSYYTIFSDNSLYLGNILQSSYYNISTEIASQIVHNGNDKIIFSGDIGEEMDNLCYIYENMDKLQFITTGKLFSEGADLTEENFQNLNQFLSSADGELVNLGLKLIPGYNYYKYMGEFALLISLANHNLVRLRKKTVETEAFFNFIKDNYPNAFPVAYSAYRQKENELSNAKFIIKLKLENKESELIQRFSKEWEEKFAYS